MATRDIVADVASLAHPWPERPGGGADDDQLDGWSAWCEEFERNLRLCWEDQDDCDPLLAEIAAARSAMLEVEKRMPLLIAYGREFVEPRSNKLDELVRAAGRSISGVRTAYDDEIVGVASSPAPSRAAGLRRRRGQRRVG